MFATQLYRLLRLVKPISESECKQLGLRDVEEVVEAFVKANTRRKKRKTLVLCVRVLSVSMDVLGEIRIELYSSTTVD